MGGNQDKAVATTGTGTATGRGSGSSTRTMPNQAVEVAFTGCIANAFDTALEGRKIALALRKGKKLDTDDEVFEELIVIVIVVAIYIAFLIIMIKVAVMRIVVMIVL